MTDSKPNTFSLELGALVPDWMSSVISYSNDGKRQSVDVKLKESTYRYRAYQTGRDKDDVRIVRFDQKLIIVKDLESEKSSCYVLFYIPTNDYARKNKGILTNQTDNFSLPQDFSGLKMWTRLDGTVARINRYTDGTITGTISFIGRNRVLHYPAKMKSLGYMLQNLTIQKGIPKTKGGQTPSSPEDEEGRLWIQMGYTFKDGQWYDPEGNPTEGLDAATCIDDKPKDPEDPWDEPWPGPEDDEDPEFDHDEIDPGNDDHSSDGGEKEKREEEKKPEPEDTTLVGTILKQVEGFDSLPKNQQEDLKQSLTTLVESSDPIINRVLNSLNFSKINIFIVDNGSGENTHAPRYKEIKNTGERIYTGSNIKYQACDLGYSYGIFEEIFHAYQAKCEYPSWTTGDIEFEARVLHTLLRPILEGKPYDDLDRYLNEYYYNPNDETFAIALNAVNTLCTERYIELFKSMTPDLSPIDRIKHLFEK